MSVRDEFAGEWQANTNYYTRQSVMYQGGLYRAAQDHVSGSSFDSSLWVALSLSAGSSGLDLGASTATADAAQATGSGDQTAYLQGLIDAAATAQKLLRIPPSANPWRIKELTLRSNSRIEATGATFQLAGAAKRFLINTALTLATPGSTRDTNIKWTGGTFDRQSFDSRTTLDGMNLMFGFIDGFELRNVSIIQNLVSSSGAYGIYLCFVNQFLVDGYTSTSQAVNAGTCQVLAGNNGVIRNVTGSFGDDMVALVPGQAPAGGYVLTGLTHPEDGGDITNVLVENVTNTGTIQRTAVKVLGGLSADGTTVWKVRNITVRNVSGTFGASGLSAIYVGGDTNYTTLTGGLIENLTVEQVYQNKNNAHAVRVLAGATVRGLRCSSVTSVGGSSGVPIKIEASATVDDVTWENSAFDASTSRYGVTALANVKQIRVRNIRLTGATTGVINSGPLTVGAGITVETVILEGLAITGIVWGLGENNGTINALHIRGVRSDSLMKGWVRAVNGSAMTVREASMSTAGAAAVDDITIVSGTITYTSFGIGFRCDMSKLTRTAGGMCTNVNTALTPVSGTMVGGPWVCDGTTWKSLTNAATF